MSGPPSRMLLRNFPQCPVDLSAVTAPKCLVDRELPNETAYCFQMVRPSVDRAMFRRELLEFDLLELRRL